MDVLGWSYNCYIEDALWNSPIYNTRNEAINAGKIRFNIVKHKYADDDMDHEDFERKGFNIGLISEICKPQKIQSIDNGFYEINNEIRIVRLIEYISI